MDNNQEEKNQSEEKEKKTNKVKSFFFNIKSDFKSSNPFSIREDVASHDVIKERILNGGKVTGTNLVFLICAIIIASIGLNVDSVAVIIGAMLISPLLGTIMAMAYSIIACDWEHFYRSLLGFLLQIIVSFGVSTIFFLISPLKEMTPSLEARTAPSWFDVFIAIFGGIAGIVATTRQSEYSNVLPGVAIATALMPPICTMGYSLANGNWNALAGSFYLFFINFYFIFLTSAVILDILEIPKVKEITAKKWRRVRAKMILNTIIALVPAVALTVIHILQNVDIMPEIFPTHHFSNNSADIVNLLIFK